MPAVEHVGDVGRLAAWGDMSYESLVRQGGDDLVAVVRRILGDALRRLGEGGEKKQAAGLEGGAAFDRDAYALDRAGRDARHRAHFFACFLPAERVACLPWIVGTRITVVDQGGAATNVD